MHDGSIAAVQGEAAGPTQSLTSNIVMLLNKTFSTIRRLAFILVACLSLPTASFGENGSGSLMSLDHPHAQPVIDLQKDVTHDLMNLDPGVLGTAVGLNDAGNASLVIYVDRNSRLRKQIIEAFPAELRGIPVQIEETDKFVAFAAHTAKQSAPIQLGTTGGWSRDLANGYCCGGTLGSLVQVNGIQYIMSNYHVLEADIVNGGNGIVARTGDPVIQPGLIDVNCSAAGAQTVGTLVKVSSLPNSNVDVSVAQVSSGMVRTDGSILEIGTISSTTLAPAINLAVKKSGRTSGLSRSKISGLNATVSVSYENECAGGTAFTKTFTGQIVISNRGSKFLKSGDSGSLMVEDAGTNPRAVGLLFAGSNTSAIANPIGQVLQFLGSKLGGTATMVGN
jgi:hypothetical protein